MARKRTEKLNERLSSIKSEERQKVKQGKKPFFLKRSAIKEIALEAKYVYLIKYSFNFVSFHVVHKLKCGNFMYRYDELKKEGKLSKFLEKKRKKNSSKDRRSLPFVKSSHRGENGDDM